MSQHFSLRHTVGWGFLSIQVMKPQQFSISTLITKSSVSTPLRSAANCFVLQLIEGTCIPSTTEKGVHSRLVLLENQKESNKQLRFTYFNRTMTSILHEKRNKENRRRQERRENTLQKKEKVYQKFHHTYCFPVYQQDVL